MRRLEKLFWVGVVICYAMILSSCGDDDSFDVYGDPYNYVYLENTGGTYLFVHTPISTTSSLDFSMPLHCNHRVTSSFSATVVVDNSLVAAYNEENGTEYAEIPSSALVLENSVVLFNQEGDFVSSNKFHIAANESVSELRNDKGYLIPLRIASVDNGCRIAENRSVTYLIVNVKEDSDNIYDEASDELVTGTLVSDRSGWATVTPSGSGTEKMFTEGDSYWSGYAAKAGIEFPIVINLGKPYTFDGICASYSFYGYYTMTSWKNQTEIETSLDGTNWEEVGILSNTNIVQAFYAPVTAQYVRITVPAPSSNYSWASFECGNFNIYAK